MEAWLAVSLILVTQSCASSLESGFPDSDFSCPFFLKSDVFLTMVELSAVFLKL